MADTNNQLQALRQSDTTRKPLRS